MWPLPDTNSEFQIGHRIDRGQFEIIGRLGEGAMGAVFLVRHVNTGTEYALKVLKNEKDPETLERFRREADTAGRIASHHVVTIHGIYECPEEHVHYIVMERLRGENLEQILKRGPLSHEVALRYAHEMATALEAAHAVGVVHRDLKPANIMFADNGMLKILDFGIAKLNEEGADDNSKTIAKLTRRGLILGTPRYLSPEATTTGKVAAPADVYALGTILFEMIAGAPPFDGNMMQILQARMSQPPPSIRARVPDVPPALDALITSLLNKDPAARPTARQTREQIEAYASAPQTLPLGLGALRDANPTYVALGAAAILFVLISMCAIGSSLISTQNDTPIITPLSH